MNINNLLNLEVLHTCGGQSENEGMKKDMTGRGLLAFRTIFNLTILEAASYSPQLHRMRNCWQSIEVWVML